MRNLVGLCDCGSALEFDRAPGSSANCEVRCACGQVHDVALLATGWSVIARLTPERSVPISGFSRELRAAADAERFWFSFPLRGDVALPVHILFSRAAQTAEVKAADLKAHHFDGVDLATDARRRWIGWWQGTHRPHRSRGPSPLVPRRVGRLPASLIDRRPAPPSAR
jgi:hypothetical protein